MALRPVQVNINALGASAVGRFWAEALGWSAYSPGVTTYVGPDGGLVWPDPVAVGVAPVPEPKTATKNRVHLDLATASTAHQAEMVARLRALGATSAHVGQGRSAVDGPRRPGGQRVLRPCSVVTRSINAMGQSLRGNPPVL